MDLGPYDAFLEALETRAAVKVSHHYSVVQSIVALCAAAN